MPRPTLRAALAAGTTAAALATLTACGGSSTAASGGAANAASTQPSASAGAGQGARGFQVRNPGTSGKIAAKSGSTLQVQNQTDGQVAVSYTAKTAITAQVKAALRDVTVGSCVSVTPVVDLSSGTDSGTGSGSASAAPTSVTAATVRISRAVGGQCTGGFGGSGGGFGDHRPSGAPSGFVTSRPSDFPSGRPSDRPSGFPGRGFFGANGKVTAVSAHGFTLAAVTDKVTVTVSGTTTYTTTKSSDASALKVGKCVLATGQTDDTGAVTADRIVVSDPVDGTCSAGFGFGRAHGTPPGAGQQGGVKGGVA